MRMSVWGTRHLPGQGADRIVRHAQGEASLAVAGVCRNFKTPFPNFVFCASPIDDIELGNFMAKVDNALESCAIFVEGLDHSMWKRRRFGLLLKGLPYSNKLGLRLVDALLCIFG